ncbi:MAG: hypothetical protein IK131_08900 [Paludibacteraceae bacterium]|nr:hypothetical protein [Paludibacteraceae bacterium]
MKKIKFLPILMAMFLGLSFGLVSCGDDDDNNEGGEGNNTTVVEKDVISKGRDFYGNLVKAGSGDAVAIASVVTGAAEYTTNKSNTEWTTNFLAGVVMAKYGVTEETEAKSEENLKKVAELKNLLDNGITAANVADALTSLASFISSK